MTHDLLPPGLEPPDPPAALRGRALAAARNAFDETPAPDVWTRLVRSPAARIAWAASVTLLAAAHLLVAPHRHGAPAPRHSGPEPEITAIARLPRLDERTLARAGEPL